MFLQKDVLSIYSKFTGVHQCRNVISIKLWSNFIEITLLHVYSPVNLLHIFRTTFYKNTYGRLLLTFVRKHTSVQWYQPQKLSVVLQIVCWLLNQEKKQFLNVDFSTFLELIWKIVYNFYVYLRFSLFFISLKSFFYAPISSHIFTIYKKFRIFFHLESSCKM